MFFLDTFLTTEFLTLTLVSLLAIATPGPDFALVLRNSVLYSRKAALYTAAGVSLGLFFHIAYILMGLGYVIASSEIMLTLLKYAGASYLLFIGLKTLISPKFFSQKERVEDRQELTLKKSLRMGFFNNVVNVQCAFFLISLFAIIITPNTPLSVQVGYGFWRIFLGLSWLLFVAFFFSHPQVKKRFVSLGLWFRVGMGIILCLLAVKVLMFDPSCMSPVS